MDRLLVTSGNRARVERVFPAGIRQLRQRGMLETALAHEMLYVVDGELVLRSHDDVRRVATEDGWLPPLPKSGRVRRFR